MVQLRPTPRLYVLRRRVHHGLVGVVLVAWDWRDWRRWLYDVFYVER